MKREGLQGGTIQRGDGNSLYSGDYYSRNHSGLNKRQSDIILWSDVNEILAFEGSSEILQ